MGYCTPVPDDKYLELLGRAVYTWAYTEWGLIHSVRWATGQDMSDLAGKSGGPIVEAFSAMAAAAHAAPPEARSAACEGAACLIDLCTRRNDILHARPATMAGEQRLNRWAPTRSAATPGPIRHSDIEDFIAQVEDARSQTSDLHEWLRSQAHPAAHPVSQQRIGDAQIP